MESLERRALVMLVVVALLVARTSGLYPAPTWLTAVYIFGLACLTASSVLLVVVIAPAIYVGRWDSARQRLLFFAFALLVADIVITALMFAYGAYETNAHFAGRLRTAYTPREGVVLMSRGTGVRFAVLSAVLVGLSLWLALGAAAKFGLRLSVSQSQPRTGHPVSVLIRTGPVGTGACRMRLVAVAPGIDRYHALDAFIIGGYSVDGPFGSTFHPLRATPRLGFLAHTQRTSPTSWRATVEFPRRGRWQLIVPNWCAPGYATPLPAVRALTVR